MLIYMTFAPFSTERENVGSSLQSYIPFIMHSD